MCTRTQPVIEIYLIPDTQPCLLFIPVPALAGTLIYLRFFRGEDSGLQRQLGYIKIKTIYHTK